MLPRGTKVRRRLEFFNWEGTVRGEFQLSNGVHMYAVELEPSLGGIKVFCAPEHDLEIIDGIRILDAPNPKNTKEISVTQSKY